MHKKKIRWKAKMKIILCITILKRKMNSILEKLLKTIKTLSHSIISLKIKMKNKFPKLFKAKKS
jgi:hypothetical protein